MSKRPFLKFKKKDKSEIHRYIKEPAKKMHDTQEKKLIDDGIDSVKSRKAIITFKFLSVMCLVLLVLLLLFAKIFGKDSMTLDGVYYLYKDVSMAGRIGYGESLKLDYTIPKANQDFAAFKNGLCVSGDTEIQIFNKKGISTMSVSNTYSDPHVISSREYVLIYDLYARDIVVYNSFDEVYSETRDEPISAAAMSYDGIIAIASKTKSYNCVVTVYNEDFKKSFEYSRNDYIVSCDFDSSGRYLLLCTLASDEGSYKTTLTVLDTKKQSVAYSESFKDSFIYACEYIGGDKIAAVFSDKVIMLDGKLSEIGRYRLPSYKMSYIAFSDDGVALMMENSSVDLKNTVYVIDKKGNEELKYEYIGRASDMAMYGEYIYIANNSGLLRINKSSEKEEFADMEGDGGKIVIIDKDRVILARSSVANVITSFK